MSKSKRPQAECTCFPLDIPPEQTLEAQPQTQGKGGREPFAAGETLNSKTDG